MTILQKSYEHTYARNLGAKLDLSLSQNPLGPSVDAIRAMVDAAHNVHLYPQHEQSLRQAIATHHQIQVEHVSLGAGANQLLEDILKVYALNRNIVVPSAGFPESIAAMATLGGYAKTVGLKADFTIELNGLLSAIDDNTAVIHLCNPNNPTGIWIENEALIHLANLSPVPILISEAGADFVKKSILDEKLHPNIIVVRSFSKGYGLAGLRVAYVVAGLDVIKKLQKRLGSFRINTIAIAAAVASLQDLEHLNTSIDYLLDEKKWLMHKMQTLCFEVVHSHGQNFIAKVPDCFEDARHFCLIARQYGISVVDCGLYEGLEKYIRITPQLKTINQKFIKLLTKIVEVQNAE